MSISILLLILTAVSQLFLVDCMVPLKTAKKDANNATEPLIYTRLRYDRDSLQTLRRFQKYFAIDEHRVRFQFNETLQADEDNPSNRTNLVELTYYQNDQIEASSLNYDSLVFEAIDRTYFTRLIQLWTYVYDNVDDISRASDKRLVSRSRCDKEMDYMMKRVAELESARLNPNPSTGVSLNNALDAQLLTMLDAFGNEESGLLMGHNYWPGNWRQCKKSHIFHRDLHEPERSVNFRARYCVASLRSKHWDGLIKTRLNELESQMFFFKDGQRNNYVRYHRIQVGVCLPESCDTRLKWRRPDSIHKLATYKLSEPIRSYELLDFYCLPDESSELREFEPSTKYFLLFLGLWCGLVVVATFLDICARRRRNRELHCDDSNSTVLMSKRALTLKEKLIHCMSYLRNVERLFETESCRLRPESISDGEPGLMHRKQTGTFSTTISLTRPTDGVKLQANRLQFLNSLKVFATVAVILGHLNMIWVHTGRYTLDYDSLNDILLHFQLSAVIFVDWHFAISGFLVSYAAFQSGHISRHTTWSWLGTIVHRYLRLAPCFVLLFWFVQSLAMHLGDGPLWDYGTTNLTLRAICREESPIWPLTLTSNFHPLHEECIIPAWYVSCDFQLFLLTPFLLTLLYKSPMSGWLVILAMNGASILLRAHQFLTNPRAKTLDLMRPRHDMFLRNVWDLYHTYMWSPYRTGSYYMGFLAGHYVYMVLSGRWSSPLLSLTVNKHIKPILAPTKSRPSALGGEGPKRKAIRIGVFTFSSTSVVTMMLATWYMYFLIPNELEPWADYFTALVYSTCHTLVGAAFAILLVALTLGDYSPLKYFMSLPFWTVLARFNMLIFLGQIEVMNYFSTAANSTTPMSNLENFKFLMLVLGVLYGLSGIFTPLFEIPIGLLERTFINPYFAPPTPKTSVHDAGRLPLDGNNVTNHHSNHRAGRAENQSQNYELSQMAPGESTRLVKGGQSN